MAGRNSLPLDLCDTGKKNYTKEELRIKEKSEKKIKKFGYEELKKIKPPAHVQNDTMAFTYWKMQMKNYLESASRGIYILAESEINFFVDYCLTSANLDRARKKFTQMLVEDLPYNKNLDLMVNRLQKMKIALTDKLFLNPVARCKHIVIEPDKEIDKDEEMFDI